MAALALRRPAARRLGNSTLPPRLDQDKAPHLIARHRCHLITMTQEIITTPFPHLPSSSIHSPCCPLSLIVAVRLRRRSRDSGMPHCLSAFRQHRDDGRMDDALFRRGRLPSLRFACPSPSRTDQGPPTGTSLKLVQHRCRNNSTTVVRMTGARTGRDWRSHTGKRPAPSFPGCCSFAHLRPVHYSPSLIGKSTTSGFLFVPRSLCLALEGLLSPQLSAFRPR